jgi:peptide deformylase
MAILNIIRYPHPILRKKSKAVPRVTPAILHLISGMIETMHAAKGVGLAAVQVGELLRVIVVEAGEGAIALINPRITQKKGKQIFTEGCLCLPGIEAPVERAAHITVTGLNQKEEKVAFDAEGLLATVLQHEVDHLEGRVFIDRVKDPSLIRCVEAKKEPPEERI